MSAPPLSIFLKCFDDAIVGGHALIRVGLDDEIDGHELQYVVQLDDGLIYIAQCHLPPDLGSPKFLEFYLRGRADALRGLGCGPRLSTHRENETGSTTS